MRSKQTRITGAQRRWITRTATGARVTPFIPSVREIVAVAVAALLVSGLGGCGAFGPSGPGSRTFSMGFTPFPHANTPE
ncbi:MAG: hypothetical protein JXA57_14990, partial [Armatimonadetes bacterium]|nr:hypothetical protein [Armatimonadota bacterium]